MKYTYVRRVDVIVRYDGEFDYRIFDCPINEVRNRVEEQMWAHLFEAADIIDNNTGEVYMTIEKG